MFLDNGDLFVSKSQYQTILICMLSINRTSLNQWLYSIYNVFYKKNKLNGCVKETDIQPVKSVIHVGTCSVISLCVNTPNK